MEILDGDWLNRQCWTLDLTLSSRPEMAEWADTERGRSVESQTTIKCCSDLTHYGLSRYEWIRTHPIVAAVNVLMLS